MKDWVVSMHNHLSNSYHSWTASKADTPVLNALQRKKMFSACPGRLRIGECFTLKLWAICRAYRAAWRLNSWSSWRSGVLCSLRWRLWYNSPCTSNGVISGGNKVFYYIWNSSEILKAIEKTLISATVIEFSKSAPVILWAPLTSAARKYFKKIVTENSSCRFVFWGLFWCRH